MNKIILVCILFGFLALVSCGKSQEDKKSSGKNTQHILVTGNSFLDAPYNWIDFGSLSKNNTYSRTAIFQAPHDGSLSIGYQSYGIGQSCDDQENAYKIEPTFKLKRSNETDYKIIEKPDSITPSFKLNQGDTLAIDLLLTSNTNCHKAEINIWATF